MDFKLKKHEKRWIFKEKRCFSVSFQVPFSALYEILESAENTVFSRIFCFSKIDLLAGC